jgi:glycosyltransferase involved in cell wall biosynthesis
MPDLTIIIPALREAENLGELLPQVRKVLAPIGISLEIIIVDEEADESTHQVVSENNCILISPATRGYGNALRAGFEKANSDFVVTMDADLSHPPEFLLSMWESRHTADILIASRYIAGGKAKMPIQRLLLSKILNVFFSRGLDLKIRDLSSGYRMYARKVIPLKNLEGEGFNILEELLVRALLEGYQIREIPFCYEPRKQGSSHARVIPFGVAYLKTFSKLWRLRNSILSADYDSRAYNTWLIPQRYWQRMRYKYITQMIKGKGKCLDVGCGSSRIIEALPVGSIGLDILIRKLRFSRRFGRDLVQGSLFHLPLPNESFPCVVCSQVIEHIDSTGVFDELNRVLKPGGYLILGTPDYSKWQWKVIEWLYGKILPQSYADEHITHYSYHNLINELVEKRGFSLVARKYILQGELILNLRKKLK